MILGNVFLWSLQELSVTSTSKQVCNPLRKLLYAKVIPHASIKIKRPPQFKRINISRDHIILNKTPCIQNAHSTISYNMLTLNMTVPLSVDFDLPPFLLRSIRFETVYHCNVCVLLVCHIPHKRAAKHSPRFKSQTNRSNWRYGIQVVVITKIIMTIKLYVIARHQLARDPPSAERENKKESLRIVIFVVISFLLLWSPSFVNVIVRQLTSQALIFKNEAINPWFIMARCNALSTPAVYVWGSPALREAVKETVWGRVCPKRKRRQSQFNAVVFCSILSKHRGSYLYFTSQSRINCDHGCINHGKKIQRQNIPWKSGPKSGPTKWAFESIPYEPFYLLKIQYPQNSPV